jgi:hypothetical protein
VTKNEAAGLVADKAAVLLRGMSLSELLAADIDTGRKYSDADWERLARAKERIIVRLLRIRNY